jgi:FAS-associated factor 2
VHTHPRAEAEAAEQRRLQAATSIAARRQQKRASLPPEPDAAGSSGGGGDVAAIRVRLPDGQNHQRRFAAAESVQVLYDWVDSLEGFDCLRYSLVSAFPKRVFDAAGCGGLSLADAGLAPQGALFVCVHDDDGEDGGGGSGGGGGGGGGDGE